MRITTLAVVAGLGDELGEVVLGLHPEDVPLAEALPLWEAFGRIEKIATAAKTLLAARVEESGVWERSGHRSAAELLAAKGKTSVGAARQQVETSKKLTDLPETESAVRKGELSGPQAAAIAEAAAANPEAERKLLGQAKRSSLAELKEACGRAKAAADPDPEATHARLHAGRRLRTFTDSEGFWALFAKGTPEAGARIEAALAPVIDELFAAARAQGRHEPREAYAFDALEELMRRARNGEWDGGEDLDDQDDDGDEVVDDQASHQSDGDDGGATDRDAAGGADGTATGVGAPTEDTAANAAAEGTDNKGPTGATNAEGAADDTAAVDGTGGGGPPATAAGEAPAASPAGTAPATLRRRLGIRPRTKPDSPRFLALLRVDLEALVRGAVEGEEYCEITGIGPIPVSVARNLLGDAVLKLVITKGVDVAHVTHLGRGPTTAQRVALLWTSPHCTVEGCTGAYTQIDHREDWARTQVTRLASLDRLCTHHHALKTRSNWALVAGAGKRPMVPPEDPRHPGKVEKAARANAPPGHDPPGHAPPGHAPPPSAPATPAGGQPENPESSQRQPASAGADTTRAEQLPLAAALA